MHGGRWPKMAGNLDNSISCGTLKRECVEACSLSCPSRSQSGSEARTFLGWWALENVWSEELCAPGQMQEAVGSAGKGQYAARGSLAS